MKLRGVGLDLVEIGRFKKLTKNSPFIKKVFFASEIKYSFSFKDPSSHLAGMFAAKEAASKALGVKKFPFAELEILHTKEGKPYVVHKGKKIKVEISITHTGTVAAAIAVAA